MAATDGVIAAGIIVIGIVATGNRNRKLASAGFLFICLTRDSLIGSRPLRSSMMGQRVRSSPK
jgi:hypothetical protein